VLPVHPEAHRLLGFDRVVEVPGNQFGPGGTGASEAWTAMLERWYATSPLSPKTRARSK
jgi:hypothetical protein